MRIKFLGAAQEVTGSKHLLEISGKKILLECGMFQGRREESDRKNRKLLLDPREIDAVILSHAHIDHSGLLPVLVKNGFSGKIFCTPATTDILKPMLSDSAKIQESDAKYFLRKKRLARNAVFPIEPLYQQIHVDETLQKIQQLKRGKSLEIFPGITLTFFHAGHVLGSAQVFIEFLENGKKRSLAFSGDLGRKNRKILQDPEKIPSAEILISESTYGGRLHPSVTQNCENLKNAILKTSARGGKILIPSFALERSQEILYDLHFLYLSGEVPKLPIFVDSPLTTNFTKIFQKNLDNFDDDLKKNFLEKNLNPFEFKELKHTNSVDDSKKLNFISGPAIIISASGMCEGGRIRHHLRNSIDNPKNSILIVGFQAKHTLGRRIVEKRQMVKIFDQFYKLKAEVFSLNEYSAHADQKDLLENIENIKNLKKIFLVHGEFDQAEILKNKILETKNDAEITIPNFKDFLEI